MKVELVNVYKGSKVVVGGVRRVTLYFLTGSTLTGSDSVVAASSIVHKDNNITKIWHRLRPYEWEKDANFVKEICSLWHKMQSLEVCEYCVFVKLHRNNIPKDDQKTNGTLDYIHSDCWGPFQHAKVISENWSFTKHPCFLTSLTQRAYYPRSDAMPSDER